MARTGTLFAADLYGITPDIMTLGKGLAGGAPLSAMLAKSEVCCFEAGDQGVFMARRRHLDALKRADTLYTEGVQQFIEHQAGELFAEDLRQVQNALSEITGSMSADDLLGEIFSSFCIGK